MVQLLWETAEVPEKKNLKIELSYDPVISLLVFIQNNRNQDLNEISALPCS